MRNNILCLLGVISSVSVLSIAAVTPATDENRAPMVAAIVFGCLVIPYGSAFLASRDS